jgi:hypothetical protein
MQFRLKEEPMQTLSKITYKRENYEIAIQKSKPIIISEGEK